MPLPAPYAPPWKRLGEDGVALLAWLGLKAREVWRRNREGLLPVPAFWPRRWIRLFWPLALLAALLVAGGVGRAWLGRASAAPVERAAAGTAGYGGAQPAETGTSAESAPAAPVAESGPATGSGHSAGSGQSAESGRSEQASAGSPGFKASKGSEGFKDSEDSEDWEDSNDSKDSVDLEGPKPAAPGGVPSGGPERSREAAPSRAEDDVSAAGTEEEPTVAAEPLEPLEPLQPLQPLQPLEPLEPLEPGEPPEPPEAPAEREARRLLAVWGTDADAALLRDVSPDLARATLTLRFGENLLALGADQRQRLADRWRDRAADEGYSQLLLTDGSGRLWGRNALVGRGMILLDPPGPAGAAP